MSLFGNATPSVMSPVAPDAGAPSDAGAATDAGASTDGAAADAGAGVLPELEQAEATIAPTSTMPATRATPLSRMCFSSAA